jgi:thiol-disulfide isomerase/thioredoxin
MIEQLRAAWQKLRARKWLSLVFDAAVLLAVFFAIHAWQTRELPVDELAPATQLAVLEAAGSPGERQAVVVSGKAGIVYFFAPWCGVCRASIGNLDGLVKGGQVAWGTVVALDYADVDEVRDFIDRTGVSLPVLLGDAQTAANWSVRAFPTYYVIDASGRIDSRSVGYSTWFGMWARGWLAR